MEVEETNRDGIVRGICERSAFHAMCILLFFITLTGLKVLSHFKWVITMLIAKNFIDRDMADVPKRLHRRYLEASEATFQA
jgi:hypothetical protein